MPWFKGWKVPIKMAVQCQWNHFKLWIASFQQFTQLTNSLPLSLQDVYKIVGMFQWTKWRLGFWKPAWWSPLLQPTLQWKYWNALWSLKEAISGTMHQCQGCLLGNIPGDSQNCWWPIWKQLASLIRWLYFPIPSNQCCQCLCPVLSLNSRGLQVCWAERKHWSQFW
jgi:hypothetical protein